MGELGEQQVRAGQGRVPAQVDLDGGREPAQAVMRALAHEERRLGDVVLGGDACIVSAGSQESSGTIAAGLPPNTREEKASI